MKKWIALLLIACLSLCGVSLAEKPTEQPALELRLAENPSTGHVWSLVLSVENVLTLIDDSFTPDQADPRLTGVGGVRSYSFAATGEGTVTLTFDLLPPGSAEPVQTRTFTYAVDAEHAVSLVETSVPTVEVELGVAGGTGYEWSVSQEGKGEICCVERRLTYRLIEPGAAGVDKWTFIAVKPGETRVTFTLARPWEADAAPADVVEIRYSVSGDGTLAACEE